MILYRYIIKELIFPFLASLGVIVFYFTMQQAVLLLEKIVSKGLDPGVVLEAFLIQLGWIIALAIPMAILTATLWTFGRMSGDNEITSIKASGQSMLGLMMPVFAAAGVLMVLIAFFNDLILPDSNHRLANLLSDISRKRPAALIEPKVLIRDFANYAIYTEEVDARSGDLKGIRIFCDLPGQDPSTTVASSGTIRMTADQQYIELTLFHGETHSISRLNGKDYFLGRFGKQVVFIKNVDTRLERTNSSYRGDREMSSQAMLKEVARKKTENAMILSEHRRLIDSLASDIKALDSLAGIHAAVRDTISGRIPSSFSQWAAGLAAAPAPAVSKMRTMNETAESVLRRVRSNDIAIGEYMVEVHKKYAMSVVCLVFVLIGAPLGIMARRGGLTVGASYSVFFFIAYWAFLTGGESLGNKLIVPPALAMWSGNIFIGACGVVLLVLMLRETTIRFDVLVVMWRKMTGGTFRNVSSSLPWRMIGVVKKAPQWLCKRSIGTLPMYFISTFTGYMVGVFFALVAICVILDYFSNLRRFEQATGVEIALYYWYYLPWIVQVASPIVLLLASMFTIGKLAKHSEIIAMKAAGISIRQLTIPLLALGALLSAGAFYGGEKFIPAGNLQRKELLEIVKEPPDSPRRKLIAKRKQKTNSVLKEFRRNFYYFGDRNSVYVFEEFNTNPQYARGVWRESFAASAVTERIRAESMLHDGTGWRFVNGTVRTFGPDGFTARPFDTLRDAVLKVEPIDMVARIKSIEEMSYWELRKYIDATRRRGEDIRKYLGDLEFKIALPIMNFIVILLGIAITARAGRKGSAVLFGLGLIMAFVYYLISRFAIVFAQNGHMPTLVGAWIGNAVFFTIGCILYLRASR